MRIARFGEQAQAASAETAKAVRGLCALVLLPVLGCDEKACSAARKIGFGRRHPLQRGTITALTERRCASEAAMFSSPIVSNRSLCQAPADPSQIQLCSLPFHSRDCPSVAH
ncbi:hypothetical protein ATN89_00600 [Comamonas thiooxydans]|nr:hypothetical protein ATN89_00600 [Comamonas thiooxydans]